MGSKQSVFTKEELKDYEELTFLNKQEILNCYNRFEFLVRTNQPDEETLRAKLTSEASRISKSVGRRVWEESKEATRKYGRKIRNKERKKQKDGEEVAAGEIGEVQATDSNNQPRNEIAEEGMEATQHEVTEEVGRRDSSLQGLEILPEEERENEDSDTSSNSSLELELEVESSSQVAEDQIESQLAEPKDKKEQQLPREVVLSSLVKVSLVRKVPELKFNPFADRICSTFSSRSDGEMSFEDFLDMASVLSEHAPTQLKADWAFKMFDFDNDGYLGHSDVRRVVLRLTGFDPDEQDPNEGVTREVSSAVRNTLRYLSRNMGSVLKSIKSGDTGTAISDIEEEGPDVENSQTATLEEIISIEVTEEEEEATKTKLTEEEINNIVDNILHEADLNKSETISISEFRYIMGKSPDFAHNFRIRF